MSSDPWKDIRLKKENLIPPGKVIEEMFSGLRGSSSGKVDFDIKEVSFFPEEVSYSGPVGISAALSPWQAKANPHPDFGYNPQVEKSKELFRYRLLLSPVVRPDLSYELFKFKHPIFFYPVTLYVGKKSFELLEKDIPEEGDLEAENMAVLQDYIAKIIKSKSTIELISKLMVF